jgi:hypothetical protein
MDSEFYNSEDETISSSPNFNRMEYELDDNLERIFEEVIIPYLNNLNQNEILDDLDEFDYSKFISFFQNSSSYYKYIRDNLE